ncbi:MAG: hypothetical protein IJX42_02035 [Oscillospiraceae bacterium]|nr:hypothetical protein [Oscillospiraceae bacterium]
MNINIENPIISYSEKGKPFQYDKLLVKTLAEYIEEYKNVPYERLTDKDKNVALARIIKKTECNGVPLRDFFAKEFEKWDELENADKINAVLDVMAKDIFGCFDKNMDKDGEFKKVDRLYCINNEGKNDYIMYAEKDKKSLFGKPKPKSALHEYFADLLDRFQKGMLPKSSQN